MGIYIKDLKMPEGGYRTIEIAYDADGHPMAIADGGDVFDVIPAADVRPVVRAHWKSVPHKRARVCSRCEADEPYKFADDDANVYNFCPNCGADMRGEQDV